MLARYFSYLFRIFEAPAHQRYMLVVQFMLCNAIIQLCYSLYFMIYPSLYLEPNFNKITFIFQFVTIFVTCIIMYFKILQLHQKSTPFFLWFLLLFQVLNLTFVSWLAGVFSLTSGVLWGATPLLGLIIFERAWVLYSVAISAVIILIISILTITHQIAYAPLWQPDVLTTVEGRIFYFNSNLYWLAFYIMAIFFAADFWVATWQKREAHFNHLSNTDSLLSMSNRRVILKMLGHSLDTSIHAGQPLSVVMLDIDHFKSINDTFGHPMGDHVLHRVCEAIQFIIREQDCVGRYGGEEFIIILNNTSEIAARQIAERCRKAIEDLDIWSAEKQLPVLVRSSFGVFSTQKERTTVEQMIAQADKQLYRAKEKGRNCVCWAGQTAETSALGEEIKMSDTA